MIFFLKIFVLYVLKHILGGQGVEKCNYIIICFHVYSILSYYSIDNLQKDFEVPKNCNAKYPFYLIFHLPKKDSIVGISKLPYCVKRMGNPSCSLHGSMESLKHSYSRGLENLTLEN